MFYQHHNLGSPELIISDPCYAEQSFSGRSPAKEVSGFQPPNCGENDDLKFLSPTTLPRATAAAANEADDEERLIDMVPPEAVVTYGPYYVMGILDYRETRLCGLQYALRYVGACPRLERGDRINHVAIKYIDQEIFQCKLTDFRHGGDGELDELCFEAAKALRDEMDRIFAIVKQRYQQKPLLKPWDCSRSCDSNGQDNNSCDKYQDPCCKLLEPLKQVRMPRIRMNRDKSKATRARVKQDGVQEVQEVQD